LHGRRPDRGVALLPAGAARRGAAAGGAAHHVRALSRAAQGATGVPLGRGDVSPPPPPRARRCRRAADCSSAGLVGRRTPALRTRLVWARAESRATATTTSQLVGLLIP